MFCFRPITISSAPFSRRRLLTPTTSPSSAPSIDGYYYTLLRLESGYLNFRESCEITGNSTRDRIHLRPSCFGEDCTIFIGKPHTHREAWTILDNDLDKVRTRGKLYIGDHDSFDIDFIYVRNINYTSALQHAYIQATHFNGSIILDETPVSFINPLDLIAAGEIFINTSLSVYNLLFIHTDTDCIQSGGLILGDLALVSTPNNSPITIWGGFTVWGDTSKISAGIGNITISERCSSASSITLGNLTTEGSGWMSLSRQELSRLYADAVIFDSRYGAITSHGLHQGIDLPGVTTRISLHANVSTVHFTTFNSSFKSLTARGEYGIFVEKDVETEAGDLVLKFDHGDLIISMFVDIIAEGGDLILESSHAAIVAQAPASLQAITDNLNLYVNLTIKRDNIDTQFYIHTMKRFNCSSKIEYIVDSLNRNVLEIEAMTIELKPGCWILQNLTKDEVHFLPSCSGDDCNMMIGAYSGGNDQFHLTDEELDRVITSGKLSIGDRESDEVVRNIIIGDRVTAKVSTIFVDGITYNSGDHGVFIHSWWKEWGDIWFINNPTSIVNDLTVESAGSLNIDTDLIVTSGFLTAVVDRDCYFNSENNGTIRMFMGGSFDTSASNGAILLKGGAFDIQYPPSTSIDAGYGVITIAEVCESDLSLGLGGNQEDAAYYMYLTLAELNVLTSIEVIFKSQLGHIGWYGIDHPANNMSNVLTKVTTLTNNSRTVSFLNDSATFHSAYIVGRSGIIIDKDITSTNEDIEMVFRFGDLQISPYVDIIAQRDLILTSETNVIRSGTPASLRAETGDFHLNRDLYITRDSSQRETFYIKVFENFTCSSHLTLVGDPFSEGNMLHFEVGQIELDAACQIDANHTSDDLHFHPSCYGENCGMRFGGAFDVGFHLKDEEFDRVWTQGQMYIGDWMTSRVDFVKFDGLTYVSANSGIFIDVNATKSSDISFFNFTSVFTHATEMKARENIYLDANFTIKSSLKIIVDQDCDLNGALILESNGVLDSSFASSPITIWGGDIELDESDSSITVSPYGILTFSERCVSGESVGIASNAERMSFTLAELARITAADVIFDSYYGRMTSYGIDHPNTNMMGVHQDVYLVANGSSGFLTFSTTQSNFRQMRGWGQNGVTISPGADISTRNGDLELNFKNGDFVMGSADIVSRHGDLILTSDVGTIYAEGDSLIEASNGSFTLTRPMEITRKNNFYQFESKFTIRTEGEFLCDAPIWLIERSAYIFPSSIHETLFEIEAGTIELDEHCQINASNPYDEIYFRPSCFGTNCSMYLGSLSSAGEFSLSDVEIDRVRTDGILRFGDRDESDNFVDHVFIQDWSYKWAPMGVFITAGQADSEETLIQWSGDNNITSELTVTSKKDITFTGTLEVASTINLTANSDCTNVYSDPGGLTITESGSVKTITNSPVYVTSEAMDLRGPLSAGTGPLTITETCDDNRSIGIGGTGFEPPELMSLMTSEINNLESDNLYIHSTLGSIWIYGVDHPLHDMQNVKEGVYISADNVEGREVTFMRENSTFRRLNVSSYGAINIEEDLSSTDGDIMFQYHSGQLNISQDVDINAEGGDISMHTADSDLFVESSFSIISEHEDINFVTNLIIKRDPFNSTIIRFMSNLTFSCHATIRLTGPAPPAPHVTLIYIEVGQFDMYENCTIEADDPSDIIHIRPSCDDLDCDMYFGEGVGAPWDAFHLTDDEFNRISTKGYLYIGDWDSSDVDRIYFDGVHYSSANSGISISALEEHGGAVEFINNDVYFEYGLNVFTTGDIIVNTSLTSILYDMRLTYNRDCLRDGHLILKPTASISTVPGGSDLYIFGSYFDIDHSAKITVGGADMYITEICETSTSIVLGRDANYLAGVMTLDYGELETLTASDIKFTSDLGHIQVYHVDQTLNMSNISHTVTIHTKSDYGTVRFTDDYSKFHTLYVNSSGSIYAEVDIFTYAGPMQFSFENGDMYMNATVDLVADGGDLVIISFDSSLRSISPGSLWSKQHSISLTRPMFITRDSNNTSLFKIQTGALFHCGTTITKVGIAANDSLLQIRAGQIDLDQDCLITADSPVDEIHLRPDCEGSNCYVMLGQLSGVASNRFWLTDSELDRVISQGTLTIGDRNYSTDVDKIYIDGISLGHAPLGTIFEASYQDAEINIQGNQSVIQYMFEMRSAGDMNLETTLIGKTTVKMVVDSDCDNGGIWTITNIGELDTRNTDLLFWGGSIDIDEGSGIIDTGTANFKLSERCTTGFESFGLGGDSQPSETMALSRLELDRITAFNIYFESYQGSVTSYGFLHPEVTMGNVNGSVFLWANHSLGVILFTYSPSTFRELQAVGYDGIEVEEDVTTTLGDLELKFWMNSLQIAAEVDIIANADLIFNSFDETIYITLPASLQSLTGNFYSYRPMEISRQQNATFTMWIYNQFDCTAPIEFVNPIYPTFAPSTSPSKSPTVQPTQSPTTSRRRLSEDDPISIWAHFYTGEIELHPSCLIHSRIPSDVIHFRPSCDNCGMHLGYLSGSKKYHLTDAELDNIHADGWIYFGDFNSTRDINDITVDNVTYVSGQRGVRLWAHDHDGNVTLTQRRSMFTYNLHVSTAHDVHVETSVICYEQMWVEVDKYCDGYGLLHVYSGGRLDTSRNDSRLDIWGGGVVLDSGAIVNAGTQGQLTFSERCSNDESFGLGGIPQPFERMSLSNDELSRIFALDVRFESLMGNMWVYGLTHPYIHMQGIYHSVFLNVPFINKTVQFDRDYTTFRELKVVGMGGIQINQDLNTTNGTLILEFDEGKLDIAENVDIASTGGDLVLNSLNSSIIAQSPSSLSALDASMLITRDIEIKRHPTDASLFFIKAFEHLEITSTIWFSHSAPEFPCICRDAWSDIDRHAHCDSQAGCANCDYDQAGSWCFSEDDTCDQDADGWFYCDNPATYTTRIEIEAGTIDLTSTSQIITDDSSDEIFFHPSCYGDDCRMLLGGHTNSNSEFHLTDAELDVIINNGRLVIGDQEDDTRVDAIIVDGVSHMSSDQGVTLAARHTNQGGIGVIGDTTQFAYRTILAAAGDVLVSSSLISYSRTYIWADSDCSHTPGTIFVTGTISTATNNSDLVLHGGDLEFSPSSLITSGTGFLSIVEECQSNNSIYLGSTGQAGAEMNLNRTELFSLEAGDIIFQSRQGHITSFGFLQNIDMSRVIGEVHIYSPQTMTFLQDDVNITKLTVRAFTGIHIDPNITISTNVGYLKMTFDNGNLTIGDYTMLQAHGGDLMLDSYNGSIFVDGPSTFETTDNFIAHRDLIVTRSQPTGTFLIRTMKHFDCNATIKYVGDTNNENILHFRTRTIELAPTCNIVADHMLDEIYMKPWCGGAQCEVHLGREIADRFSLRDDELQLIETIGRLRIGDKSTAEIDLFVVDGISIGPSVYLTIFESTAPDAQMRFVNESAYFAYPLELYVAGILGVNVSVSGDSPFWIDIDSDCTNGGLLRIAEHSSLSTSNENITIFGGSISIDPTSGFISAGYASLRIEEKCTFDDSIDIGGYVEGDATLALSRAELGTLTAGMAYFESRYGSMRVYGVDHPYRNMSSVSNVTLQTPAAGKTITFLDSWSSFRWLYAYADGGIILEADCDVVTTHGDLEFTFANGKLIMEEHVDLIAYNGDVILNSDSSYIQAQSSGSIQAVDGAIDLNRDLEIIRNPIKNSTFQIYTWTSFTCSSIMKIVDPAPGGDFDSTLLQLWTNEIELYSSCKIQLLHDSDELHIRPSCSGDGCNMYFGSYNGATGYHLTDAELDRIAVSGVLTIGDRLDTDEINEIIFDTVSWNFSPHWEIAQLNIRALTLVNGSVKFIGGPTTFGKGDMLIEATRNVTIESVLTTSDDIKIHADYDCHWKSIEAGLIITGNLTTREVTWPTWAPTSPPTGSPIIPPSYTPSSHPSNPPSLNPSYSPSDQPSGYPSTAPSVSPSDFPSTFPTTPPTTSRRRKLYAIPSVSPSADPTTAPSGIPNYIPLQGSNTITIWGGSVDIQGSVTGDHFDFSERCARWEPSVGLGSPDETEKMALSHAELNYLHADSVRFDSFSGHIESYGYSQFDEMENIVGDVFIEAHEPNTWVNFTTNVSQFIQLKVYGKGGIYVGKNITTHNGHLWFRFDEGDVIVEHDAHLRAKYGDLILDTLGLESEILVESPSSFWTTENMHIYRDIRVKRNTTTSWVHSAFTLHATKAFRCSSNISLEGDTITEQYLEFEAGTIDLDDLCSVHADQDTDRVSFRPSCNGYGCSAYFGDYSVPNAFHLTDAELDRIHTDGGIYFGDRNTTDVNRIFIQNISFTSGENFVEFSADVPGNSTILIEGDETHIVNMLDLHATGAITIDSTLTVLEPLFIEADSDCTVGSFIMTPNSRIQTFHNHSDIVIYGSSVDIDTTAKIDAGVATIHFSERCNSNYSVHIADPSYDHDTYQMSFTLAELNQFYCENITFSSLYGSMHVYGLDHPAAHMYGVTSTVFLLVGNPGRNIVFKHAGTKFRRLYAWAHGGIIVENNLVIETTNGTLDFFWSTGDLRLHPNVSLIANHADLVLNSDNSEIIADYPGVLMSTTDDILIPRNLFLQRTSDYDDPTTSPSTVPSASPSSPPTISPSYAPTLSRRRLHSALHPHSLGSTYVIWAMKDLTCQSNINFTNPSGEWNRLVLAGDTVDFTDPSCQINAEDALDRIYLRPTCFGSLCSMHFGDYDTDGWHMTDDELNRFHLSGTMYIGDMDSTLLVDEIFFKDVIYDRADAGIEIRSHEVTVTIGSLLLCAVSFRLSELLFDFNMRMENSVWHENLVFHEVNLFRHCHMCLYSPLDGEVSSLE